MLRRRRISLVERSHSGAGSDGGSTARGSDLQRHGLGLNLIGVLPNMGCDEINLTEQLATRLR